MPITQRAVVIQEPKLARLVHDRRIPKLRDDYILVKTIAVGLNPTDWKQIDLSNCRRGGLQGYEATQDRGQNMWYGTWFQRVPTRRRYLCRAYCGEGRYPDRNFDNINCEQAATLGIGIAAVSQGLYEGLSLTIPTDSVKTAEPILVYGGSTATGALGIQFANGQ
ncbi:hypothetical protein N7471_013872 [Penicillium samsonianum]|uniref:uncharacterized protein n=1 Tax=Penicillium samsonianum TaxID=1882272 RepID=UPI002546D3FA|nr:uncharacterized protein N7471_013872 [Penicillium samsonianum]KAJ6118405.1 hypothetical protein N7471_013872 [Penicillium samsonianum]